MNADQVIAAVRATKAAHPQFNSVYLGPCAVVIFNPATISGRNCFEVATVIPGHLIGGWVAIATDDSVVAATYLDNPQAQLRQLRSRLAMRILLEEEAKCSS